MGILERVMQMKQQGLPEPQIAESLKQEGISPKEIVEAISQSKIKSAVAPEQPPTMQMQDPQMQDLQPMSNMNQEMSSPNPAQIQQPQRFFQQGSQMQPSIMTSEQMPPTNQIFGPYQEQPQMPQEASQYTPAVQDYSQTQDTSQNYQEYYPEYQQYPNIETINDIAEQIVEEKSNKLKKQVSDFAKFREEIVFTIEKINERLVKIENMFHELQISILGRVGEYGKDIKDIAKEMHATQDTFSKIVSPLSENIEELREISEPSKKKSKTAKKGKADFKNYLR